MQTKQILKHKAEPSVTHIAMCVLPLTSGNGLADTIVAGL